VCLDCGAVVWNSLPTTFVEAESSVAMKFLTMLHYLCARMLKVIKIMLFCTDTAEKQLANAVSLVK